MTMSGGPFLDSLIETTWITLESFLSYSYWKPIFETIVLALVENIAPKNKFTFFSESHCKDSVCVKIKTVAYNENDVQ